MCGLISFMANDRDVFCISICSAVRPSFAIMKEDGGGRLGYGNSRWIQYVLRVRSEERGERGEKERRERHRDSILQFNLLKSKQLEDK